VYISPYGSQKKQVSVLREYSENYSAAVHFSTLTPGEAYWSYSLYLRPKLTYPLGCTCSEAPNSMYPTTIYLKHGNNKYFYFIPSDSSIPVSIDRPNNSLWDTALIPAFLASTDAYYQKLLGPITAYSSFPLQQIIDYIIAGSLLVCSDGSFDGTMGTGTFGWVLARTGHCVRFRNAGPVDCHPDMNSSYRAELSGLLAVSYLLTRICTHHWLPNW
jgi:hypothetical protein